MNWRSWTGLLILLVLAATTWWWLRGEQSGQPLPTMPAQKAPDYYFADATITRLDKNGNARLTLHASRIEHFPQPEYLALENIRLLHVADDGTRWRVTAAHGNMPENGGIITLEGNVHIERLAITPRLTVDTPSLTLNTKTDMALSDQQVIIREGINRISGTGLTLWLNDGRMEMRSDVRGNYVQ